MSSDDPTPTDAFTLLADLATTASGAPVTDEHRIACLLCYLDNRARLYRADSFQGFLAGLAADRDFDPDAAPEAVTDGFVAAVARHLDALATAEERLVLLTEYADAVERDRTLELGAFFDAFFAAEAPAPAVREPIRSLGARSASPGSARPSRLAGPCRGDGLRSRRPSRPAPLRRGGEGEVGTVRMTIPWTRPGPSIWEDDADEHLPWG